MRTEQEIREHLTLVVQHILDGPEPGVPIAYMIGMALYPIELACLLWVLNDDATSKEIAATVLPEIRKRSKKK